MDVLLVNPNSRAAGSVEEVPLLTPPLNLMYVAQCLLQAGYQAEILDAFALNLGQSEILERIRRVKARLVGFPLYSTDLTMMHQLTHAVKNTCPESKIFLAGPHASALPKQVMEQFPQADFVVRGEGELATPELMSALEAENPVSTVRGVSYRENCRVRHNQDRPAIEELDMLPIPSRGFIEPARYYSRMSKERKVDIIVTSRGCPYGCTFCYKLSDEFNGYRERSVDNVIEEMRLIREKGTRGLEIYDETFTLNRKRVLAILGVMKREGLDFDFRIRTRVSHVDDEMLGKLREAGCSTISFGVESANQGVLDAIQKDLTPGTVRDAFRRTEKHGINILAFFLVGNRGDTPETIHETMLFSQKLNPLYATFGVLHPFPGTPDYEEAEWRGMLVGEYAPYKPLPWVKLPWTARVEDLHSYSRKAYASFYRRPAYVRKFLATVIRDRNWNLLDYAMRNFLEDMSRINPL